MSATELPKRATLTEENGVLKEATRVWAVDIARSATAHETKIAALAVSGIPTNGTALTATGQGASLKVNQRTPKLLVWGATAKLEVEVHYNYQILDWSGSAPPYGATTPQISLEGGGNLTQIQTSKNRAGAAITVTHAGETVRAEITVPEMRGYFTRQIYLNGTAPDSLVNVWLNYVNAGAWRGKPEGTWLCSNITYKLIDAATLTYEFTFSFEHNPQGYKYTVAYRDEHGNIPSTVVNGTGIKDISWHDMRDFSLWFGP